MTLKKGDEIILRVAKTHPQKRIRRFDGLPVRLLDEDNDPKRWSGMVEPLEISPNGTMDEFYWILDDQCTYEPYPPPLSDEDVAAAIESIHASMDR